ncbi:hypothetical protein R1flu_012534 [Riccia fluitans]|uniref:Monoterpene synthase n=1 Tax=Riccia fluitans TaxID=41844 RepID=A0ABD1ZE84_9MARC
MDTAYLLKSEKYEELAEGFQEQVQECGEVARVFLLGFLGLLRGAYGNWEGSKDSFVCSVRIFKENEELIHHAHLANLVFELSIWPLGELSCLQGDLETGRFCYEVLQHLYENDQYTTRQLQSCSRLGRRLVDNLNGGGEEVETALALTIVNNLRQHARICGKRIDSKVCVKAAFEAFGLAAEVASWKMEDLNALEEIYGEVSVWVQNLSEHMWERGFLEKLREGVLAYHSSKNAHPLFADSLKQLVDGVDYSAYGTKLFETEWQYMIPFVNQAFYWLNRLGSTKVLSDSPKKAVQLVDWTDFCTFVDFWTFGSSISRYRYRN